jgi:hypothetical protein
VVSQSEELSAFDFDPVTCAQVVNPVEVEHPELAAVHAHVNAEDLVIGFVVLFDAVSCHSTADHADASGQYAAAATTNLAANDSTQHGAKYGPTARGPALNRHGFNAAHPAHFCTLRVATGGTRRVGDRISAPRVEGTTNQQTQGGDGQREGRSSDFHKSFLKSGAKGCDSKRCVTPSLKHTVIPAKAGIQAVVACESGDAIRHISGFPPSRE